MTPDLPLLLVPGMMCDARMWGTVPQALQRRDIRHVAPVGADSMAALAAEALRQAPPRFALAGLSMGGILAMEMLAQAPERVERLALLDTNPRAEVPEVQARRGPQMARARAGDLEGVLREDMVPNYFASGQDTAPLVALCLDMGLSLGPEVFIRQSLALRNRADRQEALAGFQGPALVLMGAEDRLCPRDMHDLMHALLPQSRLVIIDGAGHLPPLERPQDTIAALRRWLEE
ncbi:MAG: alpha/beta fold hydrolase [Pannonibacter sp.]